MGFSEICPQNLRGPGFSVPHPTEERDDRWMENHEYDSSKFTLRLFQTPRVRALSKFGWREDYVYRLFTKGRSQIMSQSVKAFGEPGPYVPVRRIMLTPSRIGQHVLEASKGQSVYFVGLRYLTDDGVH